MRTVWARLVGWTGLVVLVACGSAGGSSNSGEQGDSGPSGTQPEDGGIGNGTSPDGGGAPTDGGTAPLTFTDVAESVGLPPLATQCIGFDDFDGDGKPDVVMVEQSQTGDEALNVYLNTGNGFFKVVTSSVQLPYIDGKCAVGDIDNDGLPDLVTTTTPTGTAYVLMNKGGGDLEQTATLTLPKETPGGTGGPLALADVDRDGWLDLVSATFDLTPPTNQQTCGPTPQGYACNVPSQRCGPPPVVFRNDGTGKFGTYASVVDPTACGAANANTVAITDYNGDGLPDIFVGDDWGYDSLYVQGSTPLTFTDIAPTLGLKGYNHAMGAAFADYNLDGYLDLYVADLGSSQFYLGNSGGTLATQGVAWGVAAATTYTSAWGPLAEDFNSDGFPDVWVVNAGQVQSYADLGAMDEGQQLAPRYNSDFAFQNAGGVNFDLLLFPQTLQAQPAIGPGATASGDYDGDGRLDVLEVVSYPLRVQLMHNVGAGSAHWIEVRLAGHASNRDGIGARVTLKRSGHPDVSQLVERARGSIGNSWPVVHFGLGASSDVDSLEIDWPSGEQQSVSAPSADQLLKVEEPTE